jgi:hypothetical protein
VHAPIEEAFLDRDEQVVGEHAEEDVGLRRFFATTNCIENLIATLRHVTRNVKRWRAGDMIHRWAGLGLLRAAARFRRIKHHRELPHLVRALRGDANAEIAA